MPSPQETGDTLFVCKQHANVAYRDGWLTNRFEHAHPRLHHTIPILLPRWTFTIKLENLSNQHRYRVQMEFNTRQQI